ncbi:MAG: transcriptional repressor, partial [Candidatus Eremiobacteraeota bacterium]|nr:transcriptional repressor [Candidatus Eremiobacteraeota bacterium]
MTLATSEPRLTKNYRLVYEIVREQGPGRHLAMADLYALAKNRRPGIGFTTVYRALIRLRDMGLVSEIVVPGADSAYYEPAGDAHAHFRCRTCGKVEDIEYVVPTAVIEKLSRAHGIDVSDVSVSLHGRCADCRA